MPVIMPLIRNTAGNMALNVVFGPEAPADTSKLWVKRGSEASSTAVGVGALPERAIVEDLTVSFPTTTQKPAVGVVGSKAYIAGGSLNTQAGTIRVFDADTHTFETLEATLPTATSGMATGAVGSKVYFLGGYKSNWASLKTIMVLDTETNTVETLSETMPTDIREAASVTIDTKIYTFCGKLGSNAQAGDDIYAFDTETNTAEKVADLGKDTDQLTAAAVGSKVYVIEGFGSIYKFDTETNGVEKLTAKLPVYSAGWSAAAIGSKVYILGDDTDGSIYVLDTETDTLETMTEKWPHVISGMGLAVIGGVVYTFGGYNAGMKKFVTRFKVFVELQRNTAYLHASATDNVFPLISGDYPVTLGVKAVYLGNGSDTAQLQEAYLYDETTSEWKPI